MGRFDEVRARRVEEKEETFLDWEGEATLFENEEDESEEEASLDDSEEEEEEEDLPDDEDDEVEELDFG